MVADGSAKSTWEADAMDEKKRRDMKGEGTSNLGYSGQLEH